jgi:hypothetical protein
MQAEHGGGAGDRFDLAVQLGARGLRDRVQAVIAAYETGLIQPARPDRQTPSIS